VSGKAFFETICPPAGNGKNEKPDASELPKHQAYLFCEFSRWLI